MRARILIACCVWLLWVAAGVAQVSTGPTAESHTGTSGSVSETSFTWNITAASPEGGFVCVFGAVSSTLETTSVTWGGEAMSLVSGATAQTTAGDEDGSVAVYFLSDPPAGTQAIVVNRNNTTTQMYGVAHGVNAASSATTEVYAAGLSTIAANSAITEQNADDNSPGTNSERYACVYSGEAAVPAAGANSTPGLSIDFGNFTAGMWAETTPGQGARPVGVADVDTDDRAGVHFAVSEPAAGGSTRCRDGLLLRVAGPCSE